MKKKKYSLILLFLFSQILFSNSIKAIYRLIIGTYRRGPGARPEVSEITRHSLNLFQ